MRSCGLITTSFFVSRKGVRTSKINANELGFPLVKDFTLKNKFFNKWPGTPKERLNKLHEAFSSDVNFIWACRGGSGIIQFLSDVDFSILQEKPKFIAGYSDLTPLLNMIYERTGVIALHSPMPFFSQVDEATDCLRTALQAKPYEVPFSSSVHQLTNKPLSGIVKGGNIAMCAWSLGSEFEINLSDVIVFFEDIGTTPYIAYNRLVQLKNSKKFNPKAIVFGYLDKTSKQSCDGELFESMAKDLFPRVPLVFGFPFGHRKPNYTIPIGGQATIDFENRKISFDFPDSAKKYAVDFSQ